MVTLTVDGSPTKSRYWGCWTSKPVYHPWQGSELKECGYTRSTSDERCDGCKRSGVERMRTQQEIAQSWRNRWARETD